MAAGAVVSCDVTRYSIVCDVSADVISRHNQVIPKGVHMKRLVIETVKSILRKTNFLLAESEVSLSALCDQDAADAIRQELSENKPSFIARFGWTEINAIIAYTEGIEKKVRFGRTIRAALKHFVNNPLLLRNSSGFFSNDIESVKKFCKYQIDIMDDIDICASWMKQERFVEKYMSNATWVVARSLFDPFTNKPWTSVLEGKKVLIINPFMKSIEHQYAAKREILFDNKCYLPEFDLKTYKPVQIVSDNNNEFKTWWDALLFMKSEIEKIDFDIALVACGAFGHPLCAHIKRMGEKAVYMGGELQLMFGVYGNRWVGNKIINEHWIRPLKEDLPKDEVSNSYKALRNYT